MPILNTLSGSSFNKIKVVSTPNSVPLSKDNGKLEPEWTNCVTFILEPVITGSSTVVIGKTSEFIISASPALFNITIDKFKASITGQEEQTITASNNSGTVSFTIPSDTALDSVLTISVYAIDSVGNISNISTKEVTAINDYVLKPSIVSPVADAALSRNITIVGSTFGTFTGSQDTHVSSDWKITSDPQGNTIVSSAMNSSDLVSHVFSSGSIATEGTYYLFVRYRGSSLGASEWSTGTKVTYNLTRHGEILYGTDGTTPKAVIVGSYSSGGSEPWNIRGNRVWLAVGLASTRGVSLTWGDNNSSGSTTNTTDISTITNVSITNNILASSNTAVDGTGSYVSSLSTEAHMDTAMSNPVKNSSELTSAILAYNSGMKAASYCRGVTLKDLGAMDLPSIDALMRIYQSRDIIDSLDPTASANPSKKLSQSTWGFGSSVGPGVWSSSEASSGNSWGMLSAGYFYGYDKYLSCGCIAVKEIPA